VREAIQSVDPNQAVLEIYPLSAQLDRWLQDRRALASLLWVIAAAALVLAGAGVYATLAFAVGRRLREMAIRSALGARASRVARTIIVDGLKPGFVGTVVGLGLGLVVGRFLVGVLFGVPSIDVPSLALATALMLLAMLLACIAPAARAVRESPTRLLRDDELG
jgi:ABC-type antimicrobial peptide transport system permease subunit